MIGSTSPPLERIRIEQEKTCVYNSTAYWVIEAFITVAREICDPCSRQAIIELLSSEATYLPKLLVEVHKHDIRDTEELREFISLTAKELQKVV